MKVFEDYADFYDLLYQDKPYQKESEFIHSCIQGHFPGAKSILEFGSGSGKHAHFLAQLGYRVLGIDQSKKMVARAKKMIGNRLESHLSFVQGDIRHKNVPEKFDIGISLFHVMSYQTKNQDFLSTLKNMADHLNPGGLFIFDTWYGPAALSSPPTFRGKKFEDDYFEVFRFSQPQIQPNENRVDVLYNLWVRNKMNSTLQTIEEVHSLRYFFKPEIELFLETSGFTLKRAEEFFTRKDLGTDTWGSLWLAQKI